MTINLPNLWATDLPVLVHAAYALEVEHVRQVDPWAIAEQLGIEPAEVNRALVRLYDDGYIDGADATAGRGREVIATEMTAKGRREVGMWPSSKDGAALIEVIENAIAQTKDEDKKGRLQQLLQSAQNVGEGGLGSLAAALAARMLTGT